MAERRSALAEMPLGGDAAIGEAQPGSIVQVAAWPGTLATVEIVLREIAGTPAPQPGHAAEANGATVMATAPGRFLIFGSDAGLAARFEAALPSADAAVTDLSHGRTVLRIDGPHAAAVLAKGVAIDLHPAAFPPGRVAQSVIHHVDVTILRRSETAFDLCVLRGFAESFAEWLLDAAVETSGRRR